MSNTERPRVMPAPEEMTMIRDAILIPHMVTMVQKSMDDLSATQNLLKRAYMMTAQTIMDRLIADQFALRREMSSRNIKLYLDDPETNHSGHIVNYNYVYRGYRHQFGMIREVMRSEISVQLARYIRGVGEVINQKSHP